MTGSMQMLMATATGNPIVFSASLVNTLSGTTGLRSATMTLVNDGTSTASRSPAGGTGAATCSAWFFPNPTTGIGSFFWAKFTINTQATTTISGSATGSVLSLSAGLSWTFTNSATNNEGTGTATVTIYSDAGGVNLLASGSVSWDVGFTP